MGTRDDDRGEARPLAHQTWRAAVFSSMPSLTKREARKDEWEKKRERQYIRVRSCKRTKYADEDSQPSTLLSTLLRTRRATLLISSSIPLLIIRIVILPHGRARIRPLFSDARLPRTAFAFEAGSLERVGRSDFRYGAVPASFGGEVLSETAVEMIEASEWGLHDNREDCRTYPSPISWSSAECSVSHFEPTRSAPEVSRTLKSEMVVRSAYGMLCSLVRGRSFSWVGVQQQLDELLGLFRWLCTRRPKTRSCFSIQPNVKKVEM